MTRAALVLNTRAGTLIARPELPALVEAALRRSGFDLEVVPDGADLGTRLDAALAHGAEVVIVGGGDGTLRSACARLAGTGRTLGILPLGTLNLLAKDLNLPLEPEEAAAALARAATREIDVGEVNGEVFMCQSVLGMPNQMGRHRERSRRDPSWPSRLRVVLGMLRAMGHPPLRVALSAPGSREQRRVWVRALSVVNNPYEEGLGTMFRRPCLDGGELAVYRARGFGLLWSARMLAAMALGRWRDPAWIEITHMPALTIRSRRPHLRVMNDGEILILASPLEYRIRPRALRVLALPDPDREVAVAAAAATAFGTTAATAAGTPLAAEPAA